jgi:hypothetical protein
MSSPRRPLAGLALLAATFVLAAPATGAQPDDDGDDPDRIVVITGRADVRPTDEVDVVVIIDGPVLVEGTVEGPVVAVNGDVQVRGVVEEDVVVVDGRVTIASGGVVEGDVVARHRPTIESGGRLEGDYERWDPDAWRSAASIVGWLAIWLAFTISTLVLGVVLGLLAPRAARAVDEAFSRSAGWVVLWGVVVLIGLPIAAVIAMVTLVGLPLGLGILLALGLIYGVGYVAGAWVLGRRILRTSAPVLAFLVGWGILRLIALVPILGGLVSLAATVVGLGAIVVALFTARRGRAAEPAPADVAPPAGPPPGPPPAPPPAPTPTGS